MLKMGKYLLVFVVFVCCVFLQCCESLTLRQKRSVEEGDDKKDDNKTEPIAVTKRNFFFGFPPSLETKGRPPKPPPNEHCPRMQSMPTEKKCRRTPMKDKDRKCETKDCLFSPTVGYTVPPSYFDVFNIPQYYRYMFSKQIANYGFSGYGGHQGSQHGILQMMLAQMGQQQQQPNYGFPPQQGYSQFPGVHGYQQGFPQTGQPQGYPTFSGQQSYSAPDQGYPVDGQGFPPMGGQPPSVGGMLPYGHNPYSQTQGFQQYPQYPQQQYPSDFQQQDNMPRTRSFGFDTNSNSYPYMPQYQQQPSFPTSRPYVATMCKRENTACQCKTETDCSCKGKRPKMCTQQFTDEQGVFWVWEYVTFQAAAPTDYQEPVLKSGETVQPTFDQQSPNAYSPDEYQSPQQAAPTGQYQLRQKLLYFKKPSGCNCQTIRANKPSSSYNFFG